MTKTRPSGLELRGLTVLRGGRRVLHKVSVGVRPGETVVVVGPNGAGKTTLLEATIGAVPLAAGDVAVDGERLRGLAPRARAFHFLAAEGEPPSEVRVATLLDRGRRVDPQVAVDIETRLGLTALRDAPAGTLSRGERRRMLLYEALVSAKPYLILDEPTGVFDPLQLVGMISLFRECAGRGTGLLLSVHQMSDAEALASRILILGAGRVLACDTIEGLRIRAGVMPAASLQEVFLALLREEPRAPA